MSGGEPRGLSALFNWTVRKTDPPAGAPAPASAPDAADTLTASKAFSKFLAPLDQRSSVILLDLGPVVGSNISFFGERLDCKIFVLDLFAEVEAAARRGDREGLGALLASRVTQEPGSVDGILCWDLFDFLDRAAAQALASRLAKILRPGGGVLHGFFGTTPAELSQYTRYFVESEDMLRLRVSAATPARRQVLHPRDIVKLFDGFAVTESILLKSNTRETLLRKP